MNRLLGGSAHPLVREAPERDEGRSLSRSTYKLVVRGELDARFAYLFNGMEMARVSGTTEMAGAVADQAQLHGYIARIEELGLELLAVQQLSDAASSH